MGPAGGARRSPAGFHPAMVRVNPPTLSTFGGIAAAKPMVGSFQHAVLISPGIGR